MNAALFIVIIAMLIQQAFAYFSAVVLPNMAPAVAAGLDLDANLVGYYTGLLYLCSSFGQVACGAFILRFGAVRMSQISLFMMGAALMLGYVGQLWAFILGAMAIGIGSSVSTPASSHLLARYSPPKYAPLIFSVKQTGVPVGGLMAGILVPILLGWLDWRGAFFFCGAMSITFGLMLQPIRKQFDSDRNPRQSLKPGYIVGNMRLVLGTPMLRDLALGMLCFVGLQGLFGSYFVTYVSGVLDRPLETANYFFSIAMSTAIVARILWGWVGSALLPARRVISYLALVMFVAAVGMGWLGTHEPSDLFIIVVAVLFCISAISWHGLMLSEIARLAPEGQVGPVTGASLAFATIGMMSYPTLYAILVKFTGDHSLGFYIAAVPAFIMFIKLYLPPKQVEGAAE
jgi:MFS family permease